MADHATIEDSQSLLRHVCAELERRLRAGEDCRAEQFLEAYPRLTSDPERVLELIQTEWLARKALGRSGSSEEWLARFPQWRESLQSWFDRDAAPPSTTDGGVRTAPQHDVHATSQRDEAPPSSEQLLDEHQILGELGRGGMGVVYRAWDPTLKREVALKKIRAGTLADASEVQRFYREARAAAQLRHPNIVPIHGMGLYHGEHCFTMPLLAGGSLEQHKKAFEEDPRGAVLLVEKVARAVQAAHERDVVHRDLKPANILLDERGEPFVGDFGLAKFRDAGAEVTVPGTVLGTPAYMAPEQAAGRTHETGPRSDVSALGVILYELLTGRRPFEGTKGEVLDQVLHLDPPHPHILRPALDRGLEAIVMRCLEKAPSQRYATAGALSDDLARWSSGKPLAARLEHWLRRAWRSARGRAAVGVGAVLLALFGVVLAVAPSGREPEASPPAWHEPIEFLTSDGLRAGSRWVLGQGNIGPVEEGSVRLESKNLGLLLLGSRAAAERYRFWVEVQDAGAAKNLGLFIAYQQHQTPRGEEYWFLQLSFAERPETLLPGFSKLQAEVYLDLRRLGQFRGKQLPPLLSATRHLSAPPQYFFPVPGTWRRLTVEVTPDVVNAFWDHEHLPFTSVSQVPTLKRYVDALAANPPLPIPNAPSLSLQGGFGLILEGEARLRRVVLEPLPGSK